MKYSIFWHRRDLRLKDNAALYLALKAGEPVLSIFIFDQNILEDLNNRQDARVDFIHQELQRLQKELRELGSDLLVLYGRPQAVWTQLLQDWPINKVYANRDYEPYAKKRDAAVAELLQKENIPFLTKKDHVIFEALEVEKKTSGPYTVFTPYSKQWQAKLETKKTAAGESFFLQSYPNENYQQNYATLPGNFDIPSLESMGFAPSQMNFPSRLLQQKRIRKYEETRDFPALEEGTSRLGLHFRFGTISIREKARKARKLNATYLNELIWRDFYAQILANFPNVVGQSFRPQYDQIEWRNNEEEFEAWCQGKTGYPLVDAGMRELNATGYMHNRVRMLVASFLCKHLLIDWRWGEAYFAEKLLDFDLASNNGGWQWAAGSGTDAAPYFRIFSPESQLKKFDAELKYVKKWVKEYGSRRYPQPIVEHKFARQRCLATYKSALNQDNA